MLANSYILEISFQKKEPTILSEDNFESVDNVYILRIESKSLSILEKLFLLNEQGKDTEDINTFKSSSEKKEIKVSLIAKQKKKEVLAKEGLIKFLFSTVGQLELTYIWNQTLNKFEELKNVNANFSFHLFDRDQIKNSIIDIYFYASLSTKEKNKLALKFDYISNLNIDNSISFKPDNELIKDIIKDNKILTIHFYKIKDLNFNLEKNVDKTNGVKTEAKPLINKEYPLILSVTFFSFVFLCNILKSKVPFFNSIESANAFAFLAMAFSAFYYYICEKEYFKAFGFPVITFGILGSWQKWKTFDDPKVFEMFFFIGIILLIIGYIPALLGLPLALFGGYKIFYFIEECSKNGYDSISFLNWFWSILSIIIGVWLMRRQKDF